LDRAFDHGHGRGGSFPSRLLSLEGIDAFHTLRPAGDGKDALKK
jgi:hypothetical protein